MFTAIVLSANPVRLQLPGVVVLPSIQVIRSAAQLHAARLDALAHVTTPYCFYLDDDDELPQDYLSVLQECVQRMQERGVPMAFTQEKCFRPGELTEHRHWFHGEYDSVRHSGNPLGLHHLVLMQTDAARAVADKLPRGHFWTEHMLYWSLGLQGAVYVPRIGYHWYRKPSGLSHNPGVFRAQVMTQRWVKQQLLGGGDVRSR